MIANHLGTVADPLTTHSAHMVPSTFDPHSTSHIKDDDTQMMCVEGDGSYPFTYERGSFGGQSWFI